MKKNSLIQNGKLNVKSVWFLVLLIFPFIRPQYFNHILIIKNLYKFFMVFSLAIIFCLLLKNRKTSKIYFIFIIYIIYAIFITYIKDGSFKDLINTFLPIFSLCTIIEMNVIDNLKNLLKAFLVILVPYTLINFISIILFPNGLYTVLTRGNSIYLCWFFGYKNPQIRILLPTVMFTFINSKVNESRFSKNLNIIILVIVWMTTILVKSTTAMIGMFIFSVVLVSTKMKFLRKMLSIVNLRNLLIASLIMIILIVNFNIQSKFAFLIENILHKSLDLTDRTYIWEKSLNQIYDNFIFGCGFQSEEMFANVIVGTHPHNYMLYQLYNFGIIGTGLLLLLWDFAYQILSKNDDKKISIYIFVTLFAFIIMGLTESLTETVLLYPILIFSYNLKQYYLKGIIDGK